MRKFDGAVVVEYPPEWAKAIETRPMMSVALEKKRAQVAFIRKHMNYHNTDLADICGCDEATVRRIKKQIAREGRV